MTFRSLPLLTALLMLLFLSGCGTDSKTVTELGGIGFTANHSDSTATPSSIEGYVIKKDVNGNLLCSDCHKANQSDVTINLQWAASAHAGQILASGVVQDTATKFSAWTHYDWDKTTDTVAGDLTGRAACQRCHTATGASNFLNAPASYNPVNNDFSHLSGWTATTGSPQQELLYCWGCHSNAATGALRNPGAITEIYAAVVNANNGTNGTAVTVNYPDIGPSNVCMGCHLGREIGANITNTTDADGILNFINSHYLTAGATLFNESGYEYGIYDNFGYHKNVGVGNTAGTGNAGPCVTCHMSSAEPHTFSVVGSLQCGKCHAAMTPAVREEKKAEFHKALDALKIALEVKGIFFFEAHPYFYTAPYVVGGTNTPFTDWASVANSYTPVADWKNVMGAAFNYNLLVHDPGAYAHNRKYALVLIRDSIDFLNDGLVDGDASIVRTMVRAGFDVGTVDAGTSPLHIAAIVSVRTDPSTGLTTCANCHKASAHYGGNATSPSATPAQWVAPFNGIYKPCSTCHANGDISANTAILDQYATSNHGDVNGAWSHVSTTTNSAATTITGTGAGSYSTWCGRCHTTKGFIDQAGVNISNSAITLWPTIAGQTMLDGVACDACHTSVVTGATRTLGTFTVSYYSAITAVTGPPATTSGFNVAIEKTYPDIGPSSICIRCHSGRDSAGIGQLIKDGTPEVGATILRTHYLGSGLTLFNTGGYHFGADPTIYTSLGSHKRIGAVGAGPCVTCHMSGTAGHTFWPITEDESTGQITAILSSACVECHDSNMTAAYLTEVRNDFKIVKNALEAALQTKGIFYRNEQEVGGSTGRFYTSSEHLTQLTYSSTTPSYLSLSGGSAEAAKDLMGAAFNLAFMDYIQEPGAYVHNWQYARKLLIDSIDLVADGVIDENGIPAEVAAIKEKYPTLPAIQGP